MKKLDGNNEILKYLNYSEVKEAIQWYYSNYTQNKIYFYKVLEIHSYDRISKRTKDTMLKKRTTVIELD